MAGNASDQDLQVALRPMTRGDLPDLTRWRKAAHVRRWFGALGEVTLETVTGHYGPRIDGIEPTRMLVAEVNGRSVGFLQDYLIRDHPEFAQLAPDPDAVGVDFAIGEEAWTGRGIGPAMLRAWALGARGRYPGVATYFSAPDHRNLASRRALAKAGFTEGVWFDEPQPDGEVATLVGCSLDARRLLGSADG